MQSLAKVQAGETCEIKWMFGNADVMNFLERYGIKEGSRIRVLGRVLDGLIIGNGKVRLALGDEVAERIRRIDGWYLAYRWRGPTAKRLGGNIHTLQPAFPRIIRHP